MNNVSEYLCHTVEETILTIFRMHSQCTWDGDHGWWPGVEYAWHQWFFPRNGKPVTESALKSCLLGLGVPESSFSKPGAHTFVELEHLSFVYRTRHHKDGSCILIVSPHIKGVRFSACGHAFADAVGDPGDMARMMLELDGCIPAARDVAKVAVVKACQERTARAIRHQTAGVWIQDYFQGKLPDSYIGYEIADSTPGAMDIIRLTFQESGAPDWERRYFNIPYDFRDLLERGEVADFAADLSLRLGSLKIFWDDESEENIPVICVESDKSGRWEEEDDDEL